MSEPIYLATISIFFGTILIIMRIRSRTIIQKARLEAANVAAQNVESYRAIAERAMAAQEATAAALVDLKMRIIAIEKVLKEVE